LPVGRQQFYNQVDQYVDNRQKEILWNLLANPADTGSSYTPSLERLVQDHPQSGLLQVLLARAGGKQKLSKAAAYYNPRTLHKLVNHPEDLAVVESSSIIRTTGDIYTQNYNSPVITDPVIEEEASKPTVDVLPADNNTEEQQEVIVTDEPQAGPVQDAYPAESSDEIADEPIEEITEAPSVDSQVGHIYHSFENVQPGPQAEEQPDAQQEEPKIQEDPAANLSSLTEEPQSYGSRFPKRDEPASQPAEPEYPQQGIEDDVYDEIVSIEDIGFEAIASEKYIAPAEPVAEARFSDPYAEADKEEEEAPSVLFHQPQPHVEPAQNHERSINEQEERLIMGGIVNADYLSFDKKLDELRNAAPAENVSALTSQQHPAELAAETQEVSRYDDDKMPYSFMWWLNKTRKEHADSFQPYATNAPAAAAQGQATQSFKTGAADELQQQYFHSIFSLTSVSSVERETDPAKMAFDPEKKEDVIIERFIHTEPQIKPLSADKLDNENKAKKSSEDQDELVTETLARIYNDQMLYHKAIATYKKLILKFPEKKLYFAAQIEQLEKKTN
jgi:hypothetical protein